MRLRKYWQVSIFLIIGCSNEDVCEETLDFNKTPIITTRESVEGDENINESIFSVKNPFTPVEISKLEEVELPTIQGELEGLHVDRFNDGSKKQELYYQNNQKNGVFQKWFANGQLEKRGNYKNDRFDGFFEAWNEEGILRWKGFYKDGMQDGEWILYDKEGNALPTIYFKDGVEITRTLPLRR